MKVFAKKLLSWLCVMAMVLSLVPAVALPASAAETEIVYGSANLPAGTQDIIDAAKVIQNADLAAHVAAGTCPICGTVEGGWKEATYPNQTAVEGESRHYYVKDTTVVQKKYNWYAGNAKNMTLCLALLNTTTPKEIGGLIGMRNSASGGTINVMGSGTLTSDGKATSDGQFGLFCLQGSDNTLNLYGGSFVYTGDGQGRTKIDSNGDGVVDKNDTAYTPSGAISAGTITVKGKQVGDNSAGNTVNIFDGVTIGPETQDLTKPCFNVVVQPQQTEMVPCINMYGGTIRNGVSNLKNTSGNIHLHYSDSYKKTKPTLNLYGGTITGGSFVEGTTNAFGGNIYGGQGTQLNMYGGLITDGKALSNGGNIFLQDSSITKVNISGGIIENGISGGSSGGGNIYASASVNIKGKALIRDGVSTEGHGGNIFFAGNTRKATVSGGKIAGGEAQDGGGNIWIQNLTTISGGIIEDGEAAYGGNLGVKNTFVMTGGTIQNGTASSSSGGGNIYATQNGDISGDETLTITGGTIAGGKVTHDSGGGGNLRVNLAAMNIGGNAQILGGEAGFMGGSIYITTGCVLTVDGNAVISGGRSDHDGGNIAVYIGKLVVGGNALIKDGKATKYTVTRDEEGKITKENHVADGGNIYCYGNSTTVDGVKVYTNELTIRDNAVISGGWAVRGGNIAAENTTVNIENGVTIKNGCAGLEVDGEMTYTAEKDTVGRGGNIFHGTDQCEVNIAAVLKDGKARFGGNLGVYAGTVNFSGIMEGGHSSNFGGNAIVQGATLNLNDAELRNSTSEGQGGSLRVYNATVNMNGGAIYGGDDLSSNHTDNVWLVRGTLNMSGDATVTGLTEYGSGVRMVPFNGAPSVVTLADNASVIGEGEAMLTIQDNSNGDQSILYIAQGWTGTAYAAASDVYSYGQTVAENIMVVGSFAEDGTFTKGGTYTGTLLQRGIAAYGVDGDVVIAAAGFVAEDGSKRWFLTNNEALAAYEHSENAYVILTGETADIPESVTELNADIYGSEITVTGAAKFYGFDSVGGGKVIVAEGATITAEKVVERSGKRYVAVEKDGAYTFNSLGLKLTNVTLRTSKAGVFYKAEMDCSEALQAEIAYHGVALSVVEMPTAAFETQEYVSYTSISGAPESVFTSGAVSSIFRSGLSAEKNAARGEMKIYANSYIKLTDGTILMGTNEASYSLQDVMNYINENFAKLSAEDQKNAKAFYETWADTLASWNLENLAAAVAPEA